MTDGGRTHLAVDDLVGVVHAGFSGRRMLDHVDRLRGGSKKGVYRLTLDDSSTVVVYVWSPDEDYWPQPSTQDRTDPFGHATGVDLFEAAHTELSQIGVRVPQVRWVDRSQTLVAGDLVVLEDLRGGNLDALREQDPPRARRVLDRLGAMLRTMHAHRRDRYGRPGTEAVTPARTAEQTVLDRALGHLAAAAARVDQIAAVETQLAELLHQRFTAVTARSEYGLIHGELGPDHVHVDDHDNPVLIDIEGTFFFDVEWEHAFLELRFGADYRPLAAETLDENRLRLYRLAMYLSLVEGPLRLLDGGFPDRSGMLDIVESNLDRTLRELA